MYPCMWWYFGVCTCTCTWYSYKFYCGAMPLQFLVEVFHKKPDLLVLENKGTFLMEVSFSKSNINFKATMSVLLLGCK